MTRLLGVFAAFFLSGCGPSTVPFLREAGDHCPVGGCVDASFSLEDSGVPITPEPLENWDGGDGGPLTGIFAVEATVTANAGILVTSKQLYRLRIFQDGTFVHQKTTLCLLTLPDIKNVVTLTVPSKLEQLFWALPNESSGTYLSNGDNIVGAKYSPPPLLEVLGAKLANPATDPLPTIDAGVTTDDDMDNNPGVSLLAQAVVCGTSVQKLYVALRVFGDLGGTVQGPDVITGLATIHLDDSVVGYSDPCLGIASQIHIVVQPGSPFRAQRVGAQYDLDNDGNVSCSEIIDQAGLIFQDWSN